MISDIGQTPVQRPDSIHSVDAAFLPKKKKARKPNRLDAALAEMQERAEPGRCYSPTEIAHECGVDYKAIVYIERMALASFLRALYCSDPSLLNDVFGKAEVTEVLGDMRDGKFRPKDRNSGERTGGQTFKRPDARRARQTAAPEVFGIVEIVS